MGKFSPPAVPSERLSPGGDNRYEVEIGGKLTRAKKN